MTSDLMSPAPDPSRPGGKPVFFISNLDWGGGEDGKQAYRALNMQRELFVENRRQGSVLAHNGGGRQSGPARAGLLGIPPSGGRVRQPAKSGRHQVAGRGPALGHADDGGDLRQSRRRESRRARNCWQGCRELMEALSARTELYYSIGYLHWAPVTWSGGGSAASGAGSRGRS